MPATQRVHPQKWAELQEASPCGSAPLRDLLSSLLLLFFGGRALPVPEVEAIAQLTDDGLAKGVHNSLQADGPRIYFNEGRWGASPDHKSLYYTTGGANPELVRFGLHDHRP